MIGSQDHTDPATAGNPPQRLGDLLLASRLVTEAQLHEATSESVKTGEFLSKVLVQKQFITQDDINACFVKLCKIPHISLLDYDVSSDVLQLIPQELCLKYGLLPIDKLGRILTVAMVDPLDAEALSIIREHCSELRLKPILCNWAHFEQVSQKYFAASAKRSDGGGESMASFGLSTLPPKSAPKPAVAPIPAPPTALAGAPQAGAIDTVALASAIQEGLRGVVRELAARPHEVAAAPAGSGISPEALAEVMRASVRDAMAEALQALDRPAAAASAPPDWSGFETVFRASLADLKDSLRVQPAVVAPAGPAGAVAPVAADWSGLEAAFRSALDELKQTLHAPAAPVTAAPEPSASNVAMERSIQELVTALKSQPAPGELIAEVVRDSVGGAMQEALAAIVVQLRGSQRAEQEPPSPAAFAEMIRDTLGGVMQEAMATLVVQSRGNAAQSESAAASQEALLAAMRASQEGMVNAMRDVIETSRTAQEAQGARLAEIAEAAVQSTQQTSQLVEASLVQNERLGNLRKNNRERHASVSPFGVLPATEPDPEHAAGDERVRDALDAEIPLETLTFDTFFPGKANSFTVQIGQSVAQSPGGEYNPFFLYGHVGLGKTHLISAVGNHIRKQHPGHRVGYVSASHFSRRLKEALAADAQDAFRENYCHWDVLILDDIQFMGGRVEAQEEFFHIFNVLYQQGRQIVIASDKAPDRLGLLEQRLVSRFSSGIVAELKPPEWETRMQILRHHVAAAQASIPEEICSLIAMRVAGDIRKMVGSLRKIIAFAALSKEPVTVELATEILSHIGGEEAA